MSWGELSWKEFRRGKKEASRHEVRRAEMRSETGCRMTEMSRDCFCDAGLSDIL